MAWLLLQKKTSNFQSSMKKIQARGDTHTKTLSLTPTVCSIAIFINLFFLNFAYFC